MKVLVTYASRHGATAGIAERIAQTLERNGLEVTLEPVTESTDPRGYDAYVIGAAAYAFHWLKEATRFVDAHRELLADRPVWLFSSGPIGTETVNKKGVDVLDAARPSEFAEFATTIAPRDEHVFFGAYDPTADPSGASERLMKAVMKVMPAMRDALPAGDFRDWPAIEAWAEGIAVELGMKATLEMSAPG